EEQVDILVNHVPTRFVVQNGKLAGMEFERPGKDGKPEKVVLPADDVIVAIGQENAFPFIERDIGIEFGKWDMPTVDEKTMAPRRPASSSAATRRGDRRTSSGPWPTDTRRRSRSTTTAR